MDLGCPKPLQFQTTSPVGLDTWKPILAILSSVLTGLMELPETTLIELPETTLIRLEPARSAARAGRGAAVEASVASARATSLLRRSVARACATRSRSMLHREDWSTALAERAGRAKALSGRNEARGRSAT